MRKLGIIGGVGPFASALLYEKLIEESYSQKGEIPEIVIINYPFTNGLSVQGLEEGNNNETMLRKGFFHCCNWLLQNEVDVAVCASNTLHFYIPLLPSDSVKFFSIPDLVLEEAVENGHQTLLILGTRITYNSNLYKNHGIKFFYPFPQDQMLIDEIIDRILSGQVLEKDSLAISQLIKSLETRMNFDAVVLGCTDFPALHHRFPILSNKPFLDSIAIPAKRIIGLL